MEDRYLRHMSESMKLMETSLEKLADASIERETRSRDRLSVEETVLLDNFIQRRSAQLLLSKKTNVHQLLADYGSEINSYFSKRTCVTLEEMTIAVIVFLREYGVPTLDSPRTGTLLVQGPCFISKILEESLRNRSPYEMTPKRFTALLESLGLNIVDLSQEQLFTPLVVEHIIRSYDEDTTVYEPEDL